MMDLLKLCQSVHRSKFFQNSASGLVLMGSGEVTYRGRWDENL